MKLSERIKKIQNLPLTKRKVIFWVIIVIFGLILFAFYIINLKYKIKTFPIEKSLEELGLPELKKEVEKLPKLETEGTIKELKEDIEEIERLIEETEKQKE